MKAIHGKLFLSAVALFSLIGCASIGPPLPPSLELPRAPTDLHAARKGDKVTLTWTIPERTTDRQRARYLGKTRVCRSEASVIKICESWVGDAAPPPDLTHAKKTPEKKRSAHFTDTLPSVLEQESPAGFATYAVEVLNTAGRGAGLSNQAHVPLVPTLPPFSDFSARTTAQGVSITWQCPRQQEKNGGRKYLFRIYRRPESSSSESKITEIDATECAAGSNEAVTTFQDQTFEWEKTYFYRGTVVSLMQTAGKPSIEVEGDDTPEVKVVAHDVFPPAMPSGLQAVFSGPGQEMFIDLIWAPVTDADLDGYDVYRHEAGGSPVKLNTGPVKTPAYRDTQVAAGKTYFYSVSAVDVRGNESSRSEEASESVPWITR